MNDNHLDDIKPVSDSAENHLDQQQGSPEHNQEHNQESFGEYLDYVERANSEDIPFCFPYMPLILTNPRKG